MAKEKLEPKTKAPVDERFTFVQTEKTSKIHDEKFQTKPTTFLKDCFKRFCKNKSSVVGAIIIGVLLLGSFIAPLFNPDVNTVHVESSKLLPKLNKAGTGWWDGTFELKNISWNFDKDLPNTMYKAEDVKANAIVGEYRNVRNEYTNTFTEFSGSSRNGYLKVIDEVAPTQTQLDSLNYFFANTNDTITFKWTDNLKVDYVFGTDDNLEGGKLTQIQFLLKSESYKKDITLTDWFSPYSKNKDEIGDAHYTLDFSKIKTEVIDHLDTTEYGSAVTVKNMTLYIKMKRILNTKAYTLIRSINYSSSNTTLNKSLEKLSINDAVKAAQAKKDPGTGKLPVGFFRCSNSDRLIYKSEIRYVDFTYDPYEHVFGRQENFFIGYSDMSVYVKKGWCEFTAHKPESFKKLSEKCPVESVGTEANGGYSCEVIRWKYLGYNKMPKYLLGSDAQGHDLLTYSMNCLKTSLLVAIITSAICMAIGLVWGSVSGYFGGTVDLVMERFTDILSGVPWVVMMTLIIILLGNSIVTFALALVMTGWIGTASLTRTQFYRFRDREYVLASRTLGSTDRRLIFKHILPNALGTIVTSSVMMIPGTIFEEATISYLGLGLKGVASFGVLLSENQQFIETYPVLIIFPAIIISLLMISFNLFGNGLRDALNPTLKGGER